MKNKNILALVTFLICTTIALAQNVVNPNWQITNINQKPITTNCFIGLQDNNHFIGFTGCKKIDGTYKISGNKINFSINTITNNDCGKLSTQSAELIANLKSANNFTLLNNYFILYNNKKEVIKAINATTTNTNQTNVPVATDNTRYGVIDDPSKTMQINKGLTPEQQKEMGMDLRTIVFQQFPIDHNFDGVRFNIFQLIGIKNSQIENSNMKIKFDDKSKLTITNTCGNTYAGYSTEGSVLKLYYLRETGVTCEGADIGQENEAFDLFKNVNKYTMTADNQLHLFDGDKEILTFRISK